MSPTANGRQTYFDVTCMRRLAMQKYFSVAAFLLLIVMVLCRVMMMKRHGLHAFVFGRTHRTDFIILPFVLLFAYHLFANTFEWPRISGPTLGGSTGLVCLFACLGLFCFHGASFLSA